MRDDTDVMADIVGVKEGIVGVKEGIDGAMDCIVGVKEGITGKTLIPVYWETDGMKDGVEAGPLDC